MIKKKLIDRFLDVPLVMDDNWLKYSKIQSEVVDELQRIVRFDNMKRNEILKYFQNKSKANGKCPRCWDKPIKKGKTFCSSCLKKANKYQRKYSKINKDSLNDKKRIRYANNKEQRNEYAREWRKNNIDKISAYGKKYREKRNKRILKENVNKKKECV